AGRTRSAAVPRAVRAAAGDAGRDRGRRADAADPRGRGVGRGVPTKTIETRWAGGMRFVAQSGSGHEIAADDKDGDTGPRPTELVLAALALCTGMDIVSILDKQRQDYETYEIHATAQQREENEY